MASFVGAQTETSMNAWRPLSVKHASALYDPIIYRAYRSVLSDLEFDNQNSRAKLVRESGLSLIHKGLDHSTVRLGKAVIIDREISGTSDV
jgi:hypothetical protein